MLVLRVTFNYYYSIDNADEAAEMYAIKNKETGLFFGGFDSTNVAIWVAADDAKLMCKISANCQVSALKLMGENAQRKPVAM